MKGPEKAAVVLSVLGPEISQKILEKLSPEEVQALEKAKASLNTLPPEEISQVFREVAEKIPDSGITSAEPESTTQTNGKSSATNGNGKDGGEAPEDETEQEDPQERLKRILEQADPKTLSNFMRSEHPQTIALILSQMEPSKSGQILASLPESLQDEVVKRIASLEEVSMSILKQIADVLENEIQATGASGQIMGGVKPVAEILNQAGRSTEQAILSRLEETDPDMADSIRQLMFVFDDLNKIDDRGIQAILREVTSQDLALALKTAGDDIKEKIFKNMSERAVEMLKEDMEAMGPVRLSDVEKAQQEIIKVAMRLEQEGKIVISRGGGEGDVLV